MVDQCLKILKEGITATDKDGNVVMLTPSASHLAVVTKFLKDNGIDTFDDTGAEPNQELIEKIRNIPDFDKAVCN